MQKNNFIIIIRLFFLLAVFFIGCRKNSTNFYADGQDKGLGIFSNTGNNLLSCYINNLPWRTTDRTQGIFGRTGYEIYITRQISNSPSDTLIINWPQLYGPDSMQNGLLTLALPIQKNFSYKDIAGLNGQRLTINNSNGYLFLSTHLIFAKGTGTVYFKQFQIDSIGVNTFSGRLSGLIEANFSNAAVLSRGRFDHILEPSQINF
jgi:hypothetical protein